MSGCPRAVDVGRAPHPEADLVLAIHLAECPSCRADRAAAARVAALARALPWHAPDHEAVWTAVVTDAARARAVRPWLGRRRVRATLAIATTLCAATVAAAVGARLWREPPAAPASGVRPESPPPAPPVAVPPARALAPATVSLGPLQGPRAPRSHASPLGARRPAQAGPAERAFSEGWQAVREGDFEFAAASLKRAAQLAPDSPLAEDARYWRAIALGRAGRSADARAAMEQFLDDHPASPRAGEIAAMLGWLLIDAGELPAAGAHFRRAATDTRPAVRQSAQAGLRTLRGPAKP